MSTHLDPGSALRPLSFLKEVFCLPLLYALAFGEILDIRRVGIVMLYKNVMTLFQIDLYLGLKTSDVVPSDCQGVYPPGNGAGRMFVY